MTRQQHANSVVVFVDWPNVDRSLRGYFQGLGQHEELARLSISAIEDISGRIGNIEHVSVYADWRTAYSEVVPVLGTNYRFRTVLVPRKASGGDRCDTTIVADIVDLTHLHTGSPKPLILLCAGDADYAVAAHRALERGFEVHVASVMTSLAPELGSLATAVYPLQRYFSDSARQAGIMLTPNISPEDMPSLSEVRRWAAFIRLLDRRSQALDYVTLPYFAKLLSEARPQYGKVAREAYDSVEESIALGITKYGANVQNPRNPSHFVQTIELVEEQGLVRCVLENIEVSSDASPDTQSN
ncbi:MAG: NYN domain-containing protein [Chloroflexi bacterium]|nr:NYN domain-containing protein [Chloroflexota bacterium]